MLVSAEVEVTTDCEKPQPDCVKDAYDFEPEVEATVLLADSKDAADDKDGHAIVIKRQRRRIPHDRHHDVFVFDDAPFTVPADGLPWTGRSFINVAVKASSPQAGNDHVVLIGQNDGGDVTGDMSGISVIRSRPADLPRPGAVGNSRRRAEAVPIIKGETRVVYAQELKDLKRGEQLVVKGELETSADHLDYPARNTVEVILAENPDRPEPGAEAKRVTATDGRVCPRNGRNCLRRESPMTSPKAGVLRIEKNADKSLHVLLILETGDPHGESSDGDELRVREGGSLRVFRYPPEAAG